MKILLLGHMGMLGHELTACLEKDHSVLGKDAGDFDLTDPDSCRKVVAEVSPDAVINAAAYTNVDGAETDRERCHAVNADGVRHLAAACAPRRLPIVHFSTDYVFNGLSNRPYREDDPVSPVGVYGTSKADGEAALLAYPGPFLLLRTAWLFGRHGKNFVRTIVEKAKAHEPLTVVDDQVGCPTYAPDLALAVKFLLEKGCSGIYHVTNAGFCSWYDFAREIVAAAGLDTALSPGRSADLKRPAPRPPRSILDGTKYAQEAGAPLRDWRLALQACLAETGDLPG